MVVTARVHSANPQRADQTGDERDLLSNSDLAYRRRKRTANQVISWLPARFGWGPRGAIVDAMDRDQIRTEQSPAADKVLGHENRLMANKLAVMADSPEDYERLGLSPANIEPREGGKR